MLNANFEKNTIKKSRANRKHITEFHKTTKDVKKQVSLKVTDKILKCADNTIKNL